MRDAHKIRASPRKSRDLCPTERLDFKTQYQQRRNANVMLVIITVHETSTPRLILLFAPVSRIYTPGLSLYYARVPVKSFHRTDILNWIDIT